MTTIRMGGVPEHFNLPIILAKEFGMFSNLNIDLDWHFYPAGTGAMTKAIAEEELDLAVVLTEGAVSAIINGLKAKIIKQYISSPLIWGIHTGNHSGLNNIGNCEGKKYAISRFGSGSHLMALIDSEIRGKKISIDNFILIENINGALKSLENNESEVFFWEKYTTKSYVENGNIRRIGEFVTPWPCFQIIASNNIIEKQADILEKMNQIINFSSKQFMKANNSIEEVSQRFNMQLQDAYNWFYSTEWSTNNQISEKILENVMVSLMKINSIKHQVPTTNLVSEKLITLI